MKIIGPKNPPQKPDTAALAPNENATADDLKARDAKVDEIRATAVKDEHERRARLAHLLVHLDPSPAWQKRVAMVVGLRQYVRRQG